MFALSAFRGLIARVYFGQLPPLSTPLSPCLSLGLIACLFVCCWHKVRIVSEGWSKSCKLIENTLARFSTQLRALHVSRVVQLWLSQIRSTNILNPPSPLPPLSLPYCSQGHKKSSAQNTISTFKTKTKHATRDSRFSTLDLATSSALKLSRLSHATPPTPPPTLLFWTPSQHIMNVQH